MKKIQCSYVIWISSNLRVRESPLIEDVKIVLKFSESHVFPICEWALISISKGIIYPCVYENKAGRIIAEILKYCLISIVIHYMEK